jgi:hypothetical protein
MYSSKLQQTPSTAQHRMHGRHALHHVTAAANIQQLCHRRGLLFDSHQMNNTTGIQALHALLGWCVCLELHQCTLHSSNAGVQGWI